MIESPDDPIRVELAIVDNTVEVRARASYLDVGLADTADIEAACQQRADAVAGDLRARLRGDNLYY